MRMDPQHHPPRIWNNHQRWWQLWRSYGNTLPTNWFIFQNHHYATFIYYGTETKKRSRQTGGWGKENIHWDRGIRIATGIAPILKRTPSRIFHTSNMTTHSVLSCTKPGNKIPYPPLTSPPLGTPGNPILIEDDMTNQMDKAMTFTLQSQPFPHQSPSSYIVKNALIDNINIMNVHNTYVIIAIDELWDTKCLTVWKDIEASDFNHSGGYCYELFFFFDTCLPCFLLLFFIYDWHAFPLRLTCLLHMFTTFLPYVLHVFASRPTHLFTYLNQ